MGSFLFMLIGGLVTAGLGWASSAINNLVANGQTRHKLNQFVSNLSNQINKDIEFKSNLQNAIQTKNMAWANDLIAATPFGSLYKSVKKDIHDLNSKGQAKLNEIQDRIDRNSAKLNNANSIQSQYTDTTSSAFANSNANNLMNQGYEIWSDSDAELAANIQTGATTNGKE